MKARPVSVFDRPAPQGEVPTFARVEEMARKVERGVTRLGATDVAILLETLRATGWTVEPPPERVLEFEVPGMPPSLNSFGDRRRDRRPAWLKRNRAGHEWDAAVWAAVMQLPAPARRAGPISPAVVTLTFRNPRRTDPDNRAKLLLDGLVAAKVIRDDGPPHLAELRLRSEVGAPARVLVRVEARRGS